MPKRLVIFVEGKGDVKAVPLLAQRIVNEIGAHDALFVDHKPFRVKGVPVLVKNACEDWHRWLKAASKTRPNKLKPLTPESSYAVDCDLS